MKINYKHGYLKMCNDAFSPLGAMSYLMISVLKSHNDIFTQVFPKIKKPFKQMKKIQI